MSSIQNPEPPKSSYTLNLDPNALPNDPRVDSVVNSYVHSLAGYLKSEEERSHFPGGAVMVRKDDKVVHIGCYGYANLETKQKIVPTTLFDLGSMSKQFTALAILSLIGAKKVKETDSISKFFPEFPPYANDITVEQLIHHTSALPDYFHIPKAAQEDLPDWYKAAMVKRDDWYPEMASRRRKETTNKDVIQWIASQKLLRAPDTQFEYSNSGYVMLAALVEVVAKMPFATYLKDHLFGELGMDQTFVLDENSNFAKDAPEVVNHASCYNRVDGQGFIPVGYTPLNFIYGDGNIHSSILDLAKWELKLQELDYETICSSSHADEAEAESLRERLWKPVHVKNRGLVNYGAGWNLLQSRYEEYVDETATRVMKKFESRAEYHRGVWLGWRSYIARASRWEVPEEGKNVDPSSFKSLGIVVLANNKQFNPCQKAQDISRIFWGDLKKDNIMNRFNCA